MYGLQLGTDLSFLKGKRLFQVCVGMTDIILQFDENVSITITGADMAHRSEAGEETAVYRRSIPSAPMLMGFLHESIESWSIEEPGTLILEFSNRQALEIRDSSPHYES